ncbi:pre-mRNA-splicing factor 8 [Didymella sp. IMI 355093]|nr:pre-mRNA-splicing factor 8 [Didymella sp. IMI 355093]
MFPKASKQRPRPQPSPSERILTANIYISTFQFLAALLLTLMLLWHISTVTLVEDYGMPDWWREDFLAELSKGWCTGVWAMVLFVVPVDCAYALLRLDWWCLLHYGREDEHKIAENRFGGEIGGDEEKETRHISVHKDVYDCSSDKTDRIIDTSTTLRLPLETLPSSATTMNSILLGQPHAYHYSLYLHLSTRTQTTLLDILDLIMLAILAGHIVSYILSLPQYLEHCDRLRVTSAPDIEFGPKKVHLNVRQGCIKLNVDIHIAGGFSTFMAIVLGLLHIAAMLVRIWEQIQLDKGGVVGKTLVEGRL